MLPIERQHSGRITDESGKPLAGIAVSASFLSHETNFFDSHWDTRELDGEHILTGTTTDADGRFQLTLPINTSATLRAAHPDWATRRITVKDDSADPSATRLKPAAKVGGKVTGPDGQPLAGVRVAAQIATPGAGADHGGWGEGVTDENGRYVIGGLTDDKWNVMFYGGADRKLVAPASRVFELTRSRIINVDFRLLRGVRVTGRVTHEATGKPIDRCSVECKSDGAGSSAVINTTTNELGTFELYALPGKCRVSVSSRPSKGGRGSQTLVLTEDGGHELIELLAGDEESLDGMRYFVGKPLERKVSLSANRIGLRDALRQVCDEAGVKLELDRDSLKRLGYADNVAVTVELKRVRLGKALSEILAPYIQLDFKLIDGRTIRVAQREAKPAVSKKQPNAPVGQPPK